MKYLKIPAGIYGANCYCVYDETSREGFVIDPGGDGEKILKLINNEGIKILFIILTHGHFDHTGGVNYLKQMLNIPVLINEKDTGLLSKENIISNFFPDFEDVSADDFLKDKDKLKFGGEFLEIIETPGHTPGGITIKVEDNLFTGDTLFFNSVGRTDLPGGSYEVLIKSINEKLLIFPEGTKVHPGHGNSSTIGREKKSNPFL
ncbi:putative metallo-hydrolase [Oxobacter pfennigii]|uniref:Putative metallo-hydrolase n=1 Tax=Oxobacter pfennigii TaxID=36849 RepID=A0A0P8YYV9_9CLOT|nr:MBL fold metallo-hydrolase [Oxobacter pfennigii]KPU44983.1 putative metallo-hydrolase [Oxobacter pfennigii]